MKIDVFPHILPARLYERMVNLVPQGSFMQRRIREIPVLYDLEERFRVMDRFDEYVQVLTLGMPIEALGGPDVAPELARMANDEMAELVAKYPDRFLAFVGALPMNRPEAALAETDRAVRELGARGVLVFTNVNGRALDEPDHLAVLDRAAQLSAGIWLHPIRPATFADYAGEAHSRYELWWAFGWPYETSVAMGRLIFAGLFDRYPDLLVITHHLGGTVPYLEGRAAAGLDQIGARSNDPEDVAALRRLQAGRPIDYFRRFYADTALFGAGPAALECGLAFFGIDRVFFGTDMPFDPEKGPGLIRDTMAGIDRMRITAEARRQIYEGNARRLLRLRA
jgi:aminocarboxymuconate-semialdehyde decarboxylase